MPSNMNDAETDPLQHSKDTRHGLRNFMMMTEMTFKQSDERADERHKSLTESVSRLENALKWAGGLIITLILGVLGWSLVQQVNANEAQKRDLQQQIALLQAQEQARVKVRGEILSRLPQTEASKAVENER